MPEGSTQQTTKANVIEFRVPFKLEKSLTNVKEHKITAVAMISATSKGELVEDLQGDFIFPWDLEKTAHDFSESLLGGVDHDGTGPKFKIVETFVFTPKKMAAMGIAKGVLPCAWYVTARVNDEDIWKRIESGELEDMSILGKSLKEQISKEEFDRLAAEFKAEYETAWEGKPDAVAA